MPPLFPLRNSKLQSVTHLVHMLSPVFFLLSFSYFGRTNAPRVDYHFIGSLRLSR
uniref:Uncharacterized protein n=1 Tax=Rhizophora mucronata TaxID=61149 RepID=A0A2P2QV06_RHIMU